MNNLTNLEEKVEVKSPFAESLKKTYLSLLAEKDAVEAQLADLKKVAQKDAPELLVKRVALKGDYKPGIHKLPKEFFTLSAAKVSQAYNSAFGGEKGAKYYGLTKSSTEIYSWKSNLKKEVN